MAGGGRAIDYAVFVSGLLAFFCLALVLCASLYYVFVPLRLKRATLGLIGATHRLISAICLMAAILLSLSDTPFYEKGGSMCGNYQILAWPPL